MLRLSLREPLELEQRAPSRQTDTSASYPPSRSRAALVVPGSKPSSWEPRYGLAMDPPDLGHAENRAKTGPQCRAGGAAFELELAIRGAPDSGSNGSALELAKNS